MTAFGLCSKCYHLNKTYGLSGEQFQALVASQGGRCAICQRLDPTQVDHNHATGAVRGILCGACNKALGLLQDNYIFVASAAAYLKENN